MEDNKSMFDSFESGLTSIAIEYLRESAKWSKFLSILGFIGVGFMVIASLFVAAMGSSLGNGVAFSPILIALLYLFMAGLYVMPVYYLYKYSVDITNGLKNRNQELLTKGFGFLKSHHKFLGISAIIVISMYFLIFIVALFAGLSSSF